ncbi:adhesion G-protein coupled receptor G4 [Oryzias melastigma]|uniref:adhesion G-protein coupled receptor G4 n=1 Tax=Oryzias melastigma TaxID=30732 RepID=UPI000CF7DB39|nr:adhesion G-protein coupled receptor G4 [Oryzias melastigma]XP_036066894.1 adhesion G-protein coupled receptor G4 [Oryzias melastigma]
MSSISNLSLLLICQYMFIGVHPVGSADPGSSTSLWGKKLKFGGPPCLWQLQPHVVIPALKELSVCVSLKRNYTTEWRAFVYKASKNAHIELGLGGAGPQITVWMFGRQWHFLKWLKLDEWYSICLTWSSRARRLRVYINGLVQLESPLYPSLPLQLAESGTLTLGMSHYVAPNNQVRPESGSNLLGEIGLFRMWSTEWSAAELWGLGCADGDVVGWDQRQWKNTCPPEPDHNLHCLWSHYKIKMWVSILDTANRGNCSLPLEEITRNWLKRIFPSIISIQNLSVSLPRQNCPLGFNSTDLHEQTQSLEELSTSSCRSCFRCEVYVKVEPPASVEVVQRNMTALLRSTFPYNLFHLRVDPNSITVLSVGDFSLETEHTPTMRPNQSVTGTSVSLLPNSTCATKDELRKQNSSLVQSDQFFRVNLTLNMSGNPSHPEDFIERWVKMQLEWSKIMTVLNVIIKDNNLRSTSPGLMISYTGLKEYFCTFHIQEYGMTNVEETQIFIHDALSSKYENGSTTIQTSILQIKHIEPENCLEEPTPTVYGLYFWPETFPQQIQEMGCYKPTSERAYRLCKLHIENDTTSWMDPDMTNCEQLVTISDIGNITVTPDNVADVVEIIYDLVTSHLDNVTSLPSMVLGSVVEKLSEVVHVGIIRPAIAARIVNIVANVLLSESDVASFCNNFLDLTESMGNTMDFQGESATITAPSLALSVVNVDPEEFRGLTFGASLESTMNPEVFVNQTFVGEPLPETNATISLPPEINNFFPPGERNTTRVQFQFYGTQNLFQDPELTNQTGNLILNSYVVSASINDSSVVNLKNPVVVTLNHQEPKKPGDIVTCVFWDFYKNGGLGGWNSSGCETQSISCYQTSCLCDHLTHFAILMDVSRTTVSKSDSEIMTIISYVGCGISSIFLGITLLTYLIFEKLRQDYPSKILMNLAAALLGLSMLFLLNSWLSSFSNYGVCITTAAALHYFLLASFTWMGLEAVHMYFALVKVFNTYVPFYILKFCAVGWGIPLVIVSLVLAINKDAYGSYVSDEAAVGLGSAESCWLRDDVFFYVTVMAYILLILLCNIFVFIVVLIQIKQMKANKISSKGRSSLKDLRAAASLTVLLGLTWTMGFFSIGPGRVVMMYMYIICNSLQGLFVFLFHCLMKENVRKQWRIHLCCGRFRLGDNSDWSQSGTAGGCNKKSNLVNSDSVESDKSSSLRSLTPP